MPRIPRPPGDDAARPARDDPCAGRQQAMGDDQGRNAGGRATLAWASRPRADAPAAEGGGRLHRTTDPLPWAAGRQDGCSGSPARGSTSRRGQRRRTGVAIAAAKPTPGCDYTDEAFRGADVRAGGHTRRAPLRSRDIGAIQPPGPGRRFGRGRCANPVNAGSCRSDGRSVDRHRRCSLDRPPSRGHPQPAARASSRP